MIYKFKSQADAHVIMLQTNGDQMLSIIGRDPSAQGVITVEQIPAAIAALDAAIITHEAAGSHTAQDHPTSELTARGDNIQLRSRAGPFIELLRNGAKAGKDVVWGV